MATKNIIMTNKFQLITNKQAAIVPKHIMSGEYYTTPTEQADPNDAPPANAADVIPFNQSFGYPGGDYLYARFIDSGEAAPHLGVDEVAE